jgi:hypothetical protein
MLCHGARVREAVVSITDGIPIAENKPRRARAAPSPRYGEYCAILHSTRNLEILSVSWLIKSWPLPKGAIANCKQSAYRSSSEVIASQKSMWVR